MTHPNRKAEREREGGAAVMTGNRSQGAGVRGQGLVALIVVLLYAVCGMMAYEARIEPEGDAYTLIYDDFQPGKTLETTSDFQTWHSVIIAGELAPKEIALTLSNKARAQFYRLR